MHAIQILAILAIITVCRVHGDQTIFISQTSCTFMVRSNSTSFTFFSCITPSSNHNANWSFCINKCCSAQSAAMQSPPSLNVLLACQAMSTTTQNLSLVSIIVFTIISIIALTIFLCFCGIIMKLFKSFYHNRVTQQIEDNLTIQWLSQQKNLTTNPAQLKWCKKGRRSKLNGDTTCSICLQQLPNAELHCKHLYHPMCIGIWLKKSNFCPLCHRQDIRSIKIYCQQCYMEYIICRKGFLTINMASIHKKCPNCSQDPKDVSIQIQDIEFEPSQALVFELSSEHLASPT